MPDPKDPKDTAPAPAAAAKDADPAPAPAEGGGDLKIADLAKMISEIAPALASIQKLMTDVQGLMGAQPHAEPDGDEGPAPAIAEDSAATLGKKIAAAWRERDQLAKDVGDLIGHFDTAAMDSADDVARYALGKLKIEAGAHPVATLRGYLGAKVKAAETHAEDAAAKAGSKIRDLIEGK